MTDRVTQTWQLLASLADWDPPVRISVARGAIRGESPGRLEPCQACDGTGRRGNSGFPCRLCRGRGQVPVDPQTGHPVTDSVMTVEELIRRRRDRCSSCGGSGLVSASSGKDPGVWQPILRRDDRTGRWFWDEARRPQCGACAGTGTREVVEMAREPMVSRTDGEDVLDQLIRWRHERDQAGSYAELEHRLRLLDVTHGWARQLLERHVIHPVGARVSPSVQTRLRWAVCWVEAGMPNPIRVPAQAQRWNPDATTAVWRGRTARHREQRRQRNLDILQALVEGAAVSDVAAEFGLSERHVRRFQQALAGMTTVAA